MTDLEQLERLARLRDAGALTDSEFAAEKEKLLRGEAPKQSAGSQSSVWIIGGLLFAALLAAAYLWNQDRRPAAQLAGVQGTQSGASAATDTAASAPAASAPSSDEDPPAAPAASGDASILDFATSPEMIGLNAAYVEKRLGIPREKSEFSLVFDVAGCRISYYVEKGSVRGFDLDITGACRPNIAGAQIGPGTSFANILSRESHGQFSASCLRHCGNAADPTIDLVYGGARYNQFVGVEYSTDYSQASETLDLWEQHVGSKLGLNENDYSDDEAFHCARNPPAFLRPKLGRMKVRAVRVYFDDGTSPC